MFEDNSYKWFMSYLVAILYNGMYPNLTLPRLIRLNHAPFDTFFLIGKIVLVPSTATILERVTPKLLDKCPLGLIFQTFS